MSHEIILDRIFERLDEWRHLPAYQLERRADIFFALFLPEVLSKVFRTNIDPATIIPEFPIKKSILAPLNTCHSYNIDYFASSKDRTVLPTGEKGRVIYFVELKTDMASIDSDQLKRLEGLRRLAVTSATMEECGKEARWSWKTRSRSR